MILNVVGTNYAGKTTLIEGSLTDHPTTFLDIRNYRDLIAPDFYRQSFDAVGPAGMQWRLAQDHPHAVAAAARLVARGRVALAARFWRYFFIHAALVERARRAAPQDVAILDEGLPKKFIEAVPFVVEAKAKAVRATWDKVMSDHGEQLVRSLAGLVDTIIWVDADPDDIVARAGVRTPDFLARIGADAIRTRHSIQRVAFARLLEAAEAAGVATRRIDSSRSDAQGQFNAIVNDSRPTSPLGAR
ncbi:MAG: hypothetical protein ABI442_02725 [Gemmatimonadaceae bacterium]